MWETEVSQPQNKVRLAMYGIAKPESELGRAVGLLEYNLDKYVRFNNDRAWLDEKTPLSEVINSFATGNPQETTQWFKLRFLPVYLTFQSAIRMVGYKSISEFDRSKNPNVMKVIDQVRIAITTVKPYPLDIDISFDQATPIMNRIESEGMIGSYMKEIEENYKDMDINRDGSSAKAVTLLRTDEEAKAGKSAANASWWQKAKDSLTDISDSLDRSMFTESADVINIDIKDLHKDSATEMDNLTMVRLGAYGNVDNTPWRVDTVLRLERYCESLSNYGNGVVRFNGKTNDVYNLFKDSFRMVDWFEKDWIKWFENRFLPVFKQWYGAVYTYRRNGPAKVWQTLTATNKHQIAIDFCSVMVNVDGKATNVWEFPESPFTGTRSGTDSSIVNDYLSNLEMKATEAKLKTPELEREKSNPTDMTDKPQGMSPEEEKAMIERITGRKTISDSGSTTTTGGSTPLGTNNDYANSANRALGGQGYEIPGNRTIAEYERSSGNFDAAPVDYIPSITKTEKGYKIEKKQAQKLIINEALKAGISNNNTIAFLLANAEVETGFDGKSENLNYRAPDIMKFKNAKGKEDYVRKIANVPGVKPGDQKAIGNLIYGDRMGNKAPDDGWKYRGRGFTQITGKDNYKAVSKIVGTDYVGDPDVITKDPKEAIKSTIGYFKLNPKILVNAEAGRFDAAAHAVNPGDKKHYLEKVKLVPEYLKRLTSGDLKNVLNSAEEKIEEHPEELANNPMADAAPVPPMTQQQQDVTKEIENSPTAKGAENVNAPPLTPDGTPDSSAISPIPPSVMSDNNTVGKDVEKIPVDKPSTPAPMTPAPVSVAAVPTPSPPTTKVDKPTSTGMTSKGGTVSVSDAGVVAAIAALNENIMRAFGSQSSLSNPKVKMS